MSMHSDNADPELDETFEALKAGLVAPDASAIVSEAGRRQGQRRTMQIAAVALVLFVGGLGVFALLNDSSSELATEPFLENGDAGQPTQPVFETEEDEVPVDGAGEFPFGQYLEPNEQPGEHPGSAQFVLVDAEDRIVDVGVPDYPAFVIGIQVWTGVSQPFETTLSYSNTSLDDDGQIDRSACASSWSGIESIGANRFERTALPEVEGTVLAHFAVGCLSPDIEPAGVFDGTFEIEFGDEEFTVISEDGGEWRFVQVPLAATSTTAAPSDEFPASAPVDGASLNGTWEVVRLQQNGEDIPFSGDGFNLFGTDGLALQVEGQSYWGFDGCNTFSGEIEWADSGTLTATYGSTLAGCPDDAEVTARAFSALSTMTWGFTDSGDLVLEGPVFRMQLTAVTLSNDFPTYAPVAGASLSGNWEVIRLQQMGEDIPFRAGALSLNIEGRSYSGNDGCNGFGSGGILWTESGGVSTSGILIRNEVLCTDDVVATAATTFAVTSATRWGFTASGDLVLEWPSGRAQLTSTGEPIPVGSFDGIHELVETGPISQLPVDAQRPLLTIEGSTATLSSTECVLEFEFAPATASGETALAFNGIDPAECPENGLSRLAAEALASADYGLALSTDGVTGYWLWSGPERVALFVTPGFDLEE